MARVGVALALVALIASIIWLLAPRGGIPAVVAPGVQAQLVAKEFNFLEGPVGTEDGGLYFTDLPANKIYRLGPDGLISVAREESGQANGLVVTSDGALLAAEMTDRRISKWTGTGAVTTISDRIGANRYMAPNDLIADAQGGIYFTDPGKFGEPAGTSYVYYLPPGRKEPVVVDDQIRAPKRDCPDPRRQDADRVRYGRRRGVRL